jgi:hypothetical protein
MVAALAIGAVLLCAMLCVSWYGWITLPADARVPVHFGVRYNNFVSKPFGLAMYPAGGLLVYLILTFVAHANTVNGGSGNLTPYVGFPCGMAVILVTQIGAIWVARRQSGG